MYNSDLPIFQDVFQTGEPTANFASQIQTLMVHIEGRGLILNHQPPATETFRVWQVSDAGTTGESGRIAEVWADRQNVGHCIERKMLQWLALAGWGFATCQATDVLKISENQTWSGFGRCFFTMASLGFSFFLVSLWRIFRRQARSHGTHHPVEKWKTSLQLVFAARGSSAAPV